MIRARQSELERFKREKETYANSQMPPKLIRKHRARYTLDHTYWA